MEIITGTIQSYDERAQMLTVCASYGHYERIADRQYKTVEIALPDGRHISPEQRKKAYALMGEIAAWCGETPEYIKRLMKIDFITNYMQALTRQLFSLADCDITTAREYITFLIDFVLEHDVPLKVPLLELCDDIKRAVYVCLMHKKCVLCGRKSELHHVDAIGMGRDRKDILHIGMRVCPLCEEHHQEAHTRGINWLLRDQHIEPVELDAKIGKKYGLSKKNLEGKV